MRVRVKFFGSGDERELELRRGETVEGLLNILGIVRETVLVKVNGKLCPESETLGEGDEVLIIPIVTSG